jgi:hypothetical protein
MATQLTIINLALYRLGDEPIQSVSDTSKRATVMMAIYDDIRDIVLSDYPWNFATLRTFLTVSPTVTPVFGYKYAYPLPSNCLRFWGICGWQEHGDVDPRHKYALEGGYVMTNIQTSQGLPVKYTQQVTSESQFEEVFVSVFALRMAAEGSIPLTKSAALKKEIMAEYLVELSKAKAKDSQESGPANVQEPEGWADARYTGLAGGRAYGENIDPNDWPLYALPAPLPIPMTYLNNDPTLAADSAVQIATQQAVKTYVDSVKAQVGAILNWVMAQGLPQAGISMELADPEEPQIGPIPGPTGPQGPTGAQGAPGPTGPAGPAIYLDAPEPEDVPMVAPLPGPTGAQGPTGATGPAGPAVYLEAPEPEEPLIIPGIQGPQGPSGTSGSLSLISRQNPSAVSSIEFSNLSPSARYKMILRLLQNTSNGYPYIQFNNDGGNNYAYTGHLQDSAGDNDVAGSASLGYIPLCATSELIVAGDEMLINTEFAAWMSNQNYVLWKSDTVSTYPGYFFMWSVGGQYKGSASLSSITIATSAGTLTGEISLYQYL